MRRWHRVFRGLALSVGLLVILVLLFYVEEDVRGAHEWRVAQARLQKEGYSLDYKDLIPPEIPDDQNLAALPIFRIDSGAQGINRRSSAALRKALIDIDEYSVYRNAGNRVKGNGADPNALSKYLADRYLAFFSHPPGLLSPLEQFDALCPVLKDLSREAQTRTQCRFFSDYTSQPPDQRWPGPLDSVLKLSRMIHLHSIVALEARRSDFALEDFRLALEIGVGTGRWPLMINGLVAASCIPIQVDSIWNGLRLHAWSGDQLVELQQRLEEVNLLSAYLLSRRGELIGYLVPENDYMRDHRSVAAQLFTPLVDLIGRDTLAQTDKPPFLATLTAEVIPNGWFEMAKARVIAFDFQTATEFANSVAHRVYPEKVAKFERQIRAISAYDYPNVLLRSIEPAVIRSVTSFAQAQSRVDAAIIACALERYYLAHGNYPNALTGLTGDSPRPLPIDVVNGQPFRYKLLPVGGYRLYSVGWNQIDDGGLVSRDREQGDWVWPEITPTQPGK